MPTDDLLVRLINHRVSDDTARWEDYLTECFAWLLENDPGLRATLLGKGGLLVGKCGPCHTYEPNASIKTQVTLPDQCRPDITISGERTTILIECKVGAPYDSEQIGQYLSHARLRAEAYVVAIVPARSVPFNSGHDGAERFLGIVTWESVSQAIVDAEPTGNVGDDFRGWFLQLLKQYQLVPHAGPLHWEKDNGEQDVEGVKKLCGVFDGAVNRIQGDPSQLGHIPRLYRQAQSGTAHLLAGAKMTASAFSAKPEDVRATSESSSVNGPLSSASNARLQRSPCGSIAMTGVPASTHSSTTTLESTVFPEPLEPKTIMWE